jgi:beta-aspartyl-peptidase (threonine type)
MSSGLVASQVVLGIHGGTGIEQKKMTLDFAKRLRAGLDAALQAGYARLQKGGTSIDAVEAAVRVLEDTPEFNAGRGAVFSGEGRNELDAAIMSGRDKDAGAVAGILHLKNPISAARLVMEKSPHVFLIGEGAEAFAKLHHLDWVQPSYFRTEERWQELADARKAAHEPMPHQWGTVGAVALDSSGNLAAATSTGGMVNKQFGRVGDTPIIGGGTYADNAAGAVSATGHGEFFIRFAVAHEIISLMKYKGLSVEQAANEVVGVQLKNAGGEGAVIALDPRGNFAMARNCEGLYRGYVTQDGQCRAFLYDT